MAIITCPDCGSVTPEGVEFIERDIITYVCHTGICDCRFEVKATCPADLRKAHWDIFSQRVSIGFIIAFGLLLYVVLPTTLIVGLVKLIKWLT